MVRWSNLSPEMQKNRYNLIPRGFQGMGKRRLEETGRLLVVSGADVEIVALRGGKIFESSF